MLQEMLLDYYFTDVKLSGWNGANLYAVGSFNL